MMATHFEMVDGVEVEITQEQYEAMFPPVAPTVADVVAERERRLALGFDYDVGDGRGVHHIGTTPDDMRKWMDEVLSLIHI